jgi:hypothetical protein
VTALLKELIPPLAALFGVLIGCLVFVHFVAPRRDGFAALATFLFLLMGSQVYDAFDSLADQNHDVLSRATAVAADLLVVSLAGKILVSLLLHRLTTLTAALMTVFAFFASFGLHYLDDLEPQLYVNLSPAAAEAASGVLSFFSLLAHSLVVSGVMIYVERKRSHAQKQISSHSN